MKEWAGAWAGSLPMPTRPIRKIVLVVLLHGGARIISGPHASEIAGRMYHNLYQRNYFAQKDSSPSGYFYGFDSHLRRRGQRRRLPVAFTCAPFPRGFRECPTLWCGGSSV